MHPIIIKAIKFIALYVSQVGALWGLVEGYSYFRGDALTALLGPYWVVIYIIPLFTTSYIMLRGRSAEIAVQESISTEGHFSPGKVVGNYSIRKQSEDFGESASSSDTLEQKQQDTPTEKPTKSIRTKGNYSPGEIGGDYTIEG